jgi:hypothetical protein
MSGQRISCEPIKKKPDEDLRINVDFTLYGLASDELLTGTPVVTEVDSSDLTIDNEAVNIATFINRRRKTVEIGGTPPQFLEVTCPIEVRIRD